MLCPSCGNEIPDTTTICPNCGSNVAEVQAAQQQPFQQTEQPVEDIPSTPLESNYRFSYNKAVVQFAESHGIKMNWYKVLTVALLYISAALNFLIAYSDLYTTITGLMEHDNGAYYFAPPAVRAVMLVDGIICIGLGSGMLRARKKLARFEGSAPQFYLSVLLVNIIATFAYRLAYIALWGRLSLVSIANVGVRSIIPAVFFVLNKIYFDKRKHLFTA